jgi:hypothetical protein
MSTSDIVGLIGLPVTILTAVVLYLRWRSTVIFTEPGVILALQNQNTKLSSDLDEERGKRRHVESVVDDLSERVDNLILEAETNRTILKILERKNDELTIRADNLERQLVETIKELEIANLNIEFLLDYIKEQGIDIPDLKFRGGSLPFAQRKD